MPKKSTNEKGNKNVDEEIDLDSGLEDLDDEEPLPIKRDTTIFNIKKEEKDDDEDFDEDVFV